MFLLKLKDVLLHGTSFKLRQYEQAVLDGWRKHLSPEAQSLLAAQMEHLISYQRQAGGKELVFFTLEKRPYPGVPDDVLFPCKLGSCVVVTAVV